MTLVEELSTGLRQAAGEFCPGGPIQGEVVREMPNSGEQRSHHPSFGSPLEDPLREFLLPPSPCFLGSGLKGIRVNPAP